jgi:hypothetical protein
VGRPLSRLEVRLPESIPMSDHANGFFADLSDTVIEEIPG